VSRHLAGDQRVVDVKGMLYAQAQGTKVTNKRDIVLKYILMHAAPL